MTTYGATEVRDVVRIYNERVGVVFIDMTIALIFTFIKFAFYILAVALVGGFMVMNIIDKIKLLSLRIGNRRSVYGKH